MDDPDSPRAGGTLFMFSFRQSMTGSRPTHISIYVVPVYFAQGNPFCYWTATGADG